MYINGFHSKLQRAWQKNKTTTINTSILINLHDKANLYNKEIHITYIDLIKAYDSVEYWLIKQTLEFYNLNSHFTKIIMLMLTDTNLSVITNHGITSYFKVERGVRQEDIISLTYFYYGSTYYSNT
jgi:Reverse transcriptase (RNA-dependent DNA polymerase)